MQASAYRRIPLRRKDGTVRARALVDAADFEELNRYRWWYSCGYAARRVILKDGRTSILSMHRQVLGLGYGDGGETDHINRDKLDNRRANLRIVTHAENAQNVGPRRGSASRYRAVYWRPDRGRWRARVRVRGRTVSLGYFDDEDEAGEVVRRFLHSRRR